MPVAAPVVRPARAPAMRVWSVPVGSGTVRAPAPFRMLGVTWSRHAEIGVSVRTTADGRRWSPWAELGPGHDAPDRGTEADRAGTAPLWVGRAVAVQARFDGGVPRGARIHLVDPGPGPAAALRSAAASPVAPGVVSRADWGADESIRRAEPRYAPALHMAFVHHTATGNGYAQSDAAAVVRSIYAYHVRGRGWDDIGYNLLVDRFGRVYEGRAGGLDRPVIGAHALGFNTGSSGVAVIGTFGSASPPVPAMRSLEDTLAWKLDQHHIDPRGSAVVRSGGSPRYPAGEIAVLPAIAGHRDTGDTDCPGGALYGALPAVRERVAVIGDPKAFDPRAGAAVTPNGDGVADVTEATVRFSSAVSWTAEVIDGAGTAIRRMSGTGHHASVAWDGRDAAGIALPHGRYAVRFSGRGERGSVRPVSVFVDVWSWPDGAALDGPDGIWLLERGALRRVSGPAALASRMPPSEAVAVGAPLAPAFVRGADAGFRDGAVARSDGRLWLVSEGRRRPATAATLRSLGYDLASVLDARADELDPHAVGPPLEADATRPAGTVLRGMTLPPVWKLSPARVLASAAVRASHGIRDVDMVGPADAEMAASVPLFPLGFRDGTLLTTGQGRVWVVSNGKRRWVTSAERFGALGYEWRNVRVVGEHEAAMHPEGAPL